MSELNEGTLLRWIDQAPDAMPLGIVIAPVNEETIYVLMADHQGNTDLELFIARPEDTGVGASKLVQESMEVVEQGDPELMFLLRELGPRWWQIGDHLDGEHADRADPECLLCREGESPDLRFP